MSWNLLGSGRAGIQNTLVLLPLLNHDLNKGRLNWPDALWLVCCLPAFPWNEHLCTFACLLTHLTPSPLCRSSQDGLLPRGWWGSGSQKTETEPPGHFASGTNDRKHPFNRLLIPYIDLNEALPISVFCKRSRTQQHSGAGSPGLGLLLQRHQSFDPVLLQGHLGKVETAGRPAGTCWKRGPKPRLCQSPCYCGQNLCHGDGLRPGSPIPWTSRGGEVVSGHGKS